MRKLLLLMLILPLVVVSQESESFLLNMSEITVKHGHSMQFKEGVKAWKKCYMDNGGEDKWNIWSRVQGEGTVYAFTSRMANWAEMDEDQDEAGKKCYMNVVNLIRPHVTSVKYNIARAMMNVSKNVTMGEDTKVVWVYNVQVNNSSKFNEVIKEINASLVKAEGSSRGMWYSVQGGGPDEADYFVAIPFNSFAELDEDRDGVWKIHEKEHGKSKTEALRAKFREAVDNDWSYMYTLNKDLSNR